MKSPQQFLFQKATAQWKIVQAPIKQLTRNALVKCGTSRVDLSQELQMDSCNCSRWDKNAEC
jgi:hypothetical protein